MDTARLERRLARERARSAELERVIEDKTRELFQANESLREHNESLEELVAERTADLQMALKVAEAASAAKSDFLAQMSHELRTPLHGLNGTIEALSRTDLDRGQRHLIELCQQSGTRLLRVIGDVLDFSRIESGRMDLENRPTRLREVIDASTASFAALAEDKGIRLRTELPGDSLCVNLDSHRLGQVLANLLSNAIKFTESGEVLVRVEFEDLGGGRVRVSWFVSDTGCGMSPESASRIFDAFAQAEAATTRKFGGTGLGLSIVRGIVEAMGGTIRVCSEPGKGSTFAFITEHDLAEPEESGEDGGAAAVDLSDLRILVVDDHPVNRTLCQVMLESTGCELQFADSGFEAIRSVEQQQPDLILMDCHMPGMTGLEATEKLREAGYDQPILAVSADVSSQNEAAVRKVGMQGILGKPFLQSALMSAIGQALSGQAILPRDQKQSGEDPLFCPESMFEIVGGKREMIGKLCSLFLERLDETVQELITAMREGDARRQRYHAHALKGSAAVVAAIRLQNLMAELEKAGKDDQCCPDRADEVAAVAAATDRALREQLTSDG